MSALAHEYFGAPDPGSTAGAELRAWADQASHWIARADRTEALTAPATAALLARLDPRAGDRILDVAAGCGDPALRIAALVGPTGAVTATDAIPEMLAELASRARGRGLDQLRTLLTTAEALELPAGSHDGACSRFGVMFFADPLAALAHLRRAVRAGGRLVVVAWGLPEANPYFTVSMAALDAAGAPPLASPAGLKTVFEFSEPGRLVACARQAGWTSVTEEAVRFAMNIPDTTPETALETLALLSRKVETRIAGLELAARNRVRQVLAERLRPYAQGDDLSFPAQALLVSGVA